MKAELPGVSILGAVYPMKENHIKDIARCYF